MTVRRLVALARAVGYVVALALVVSVAVTAVRDASFADLRWPWLLPALVAALVWWSLLAAGWGVLADGRASRAGASLWCRTQALRYLPGGFWGPASRVVSVSGTATDRLLTVFTENLVSLCAGLAVAGVALTLAGRPEWLALVLTPAAPLVLARLAAVRSRVDGWRTGRTTVLYVGAFAAYAVAAIFAQSAVSGFADPAAIAGAATLAWAAGLVVVIAPGGLGVREAAYLALMHGQLGRGDLAAGAVALRLATIGAELLVLVLVGRPSSPGVEETRTGSEPVTP